MIITRKATLSFGTAALLSAFALTGCQTSTPEPARAQAAPAAPIAEVAAEPLPDLGCGSATNACEIDGVSVTVRAES